MVMKGCTTIYQHKKHLRNHIFDFFWRLCIHPSIYSFVPYSSIYSLIYPFIYFLIFLKTHSSIALKMKTKLAKQLLDRIFCIMAQKMCNDARVKNQSSGYVFRIPIVSNQRNICQFIFSNFHFHLFNYYRSVQQQLLMRIISV